MQSAADFLWRSASGFEANMCDSCNSSDYVDLERLPLPYLVLDLKKYVTIPIAVQYLKGGYGSVDMGAMMGVLVLAIIPIIIFYLFCQRYIIEGVVAGAVKG